jgi:molybdopterin molybdotransferase
MSASATLTSIDDALALVAARVQALEAEDVPLADAAGRFLADAVTATADLPPFASSAMDGFAVRAADTPGSLRIAGESSAGTPFSGTVGPGNAITISTGAVVPDGADAIVPVEETRQATTGPSGAHVEIPEAARAGDHIRPPGSDIHAGQLLLDPGARIGAAQIGAVAAAGLMSLRCSRRPRVAILGTGSELRQLGESLGPGEIYDSNLPMLRAALQAAGAEVTRIGTVEDTSAAHREALHRALDHDVVISTGGVSVGPHDLVRGVGASLGVEEVFWRVALRPGKPIWFGARDRTLVFGLPGNPVSALVCFELFVRPALLAMQGAPFRAPFLPGVLTAPARPSRQRDDLIRVRFDGALEGAVGLEPISEQQSHQIAVTARADAVARIPAGEEDLPAGTAVSYLALS